MEENLPTFYFLVDIAGQKAVFREVSGLDAEAQVIEYRHGNNPDFSPIKMPGIRKSSNVTLKRGVFQDDKTFWAWFNRFKMHSIEREAVVINLLDEQKKPTMTWTLKNAWPTKITGIELKSDGNEVAVDTVELAHEGVVPSNG